MADSRQTPRVVFLDRDTLPRDVELRPLEFDHELVVHGATDVSEVAERIRGATIIITNKVPVRASAIGVAPELKLIAAAATGSDTVDLPACRERGMRPLRPMTGQSIAMRASVDVEFLLP